MRPIVKAISVRDFADSRRVLVASYVESEVRPIKHPVTGEEHRARIVLPDGFEYKEAEMGNAVRFWVRSGGLSFEHTNSYAQLNEFDWANH